MNVIKKVNVIRDANRPMRFKTGKSEGKIVTLCPSKRLIRRGIACLLRGILPNVATPPNLTPFTSEHANPSLRHSISG
jgi:hypothetical protein